MLELKNVGEQSLDSLDVIPLVILLVLRMSHIIGCSKRKQKNVLPS